MFPPQKVLFYAIFDDADDKKIKTWNKKLKARKRKGKILLYEGKIVIKTTPQVEKHWKLGIWDLLG